MKFSSKTAHTPHARMRGKVTPLVTAVLSLATLGLIVWGVYLMTSGSQGSAAEVDTRTAGPVWFDVRTQDIELAIIASGEFETKRKVEIKSEVEGTTTVVEVVPEGVMVKEGDVIMRLADDDINSRIEQELLSLEQAKADHVSAQQSLAIDQTDAESQVRTAQVKLQLAELDLAKWQSGDDPKTKRDLALALEKAKRTLTRDKRDLELSEQLYEQKFISLSELEDDQIAVIEAENALKTASQAIEIYEQYTRPKEQQKLLSDVTQAKEELERTRRRAEININRSKSTLAVRTRTLRIREERYAKLQDQLKATVITAPQDGLVVYGTTVGNRRGRSDPIAQGRQVRFNELLIVLPDTRQMVAAVKVNETMMPMVEVGQKAAITSDFRPGKIMEGAVSQIGVMAEDGGWFNPDVREYSVKIDLPPGTDQELKPAMRCSARILVGQLDDVLAVPLQAVVTRGNDRFVYVPAAGGKVRRQSVKIGRNNESMVEITAGLEEGDRVLLRRPRAGELLDESEAPDAPAPKATDETPDTSAAPQADAQPAPEAGATSGDANANGQSNATPAGQREGRAQGRRSRNGEQRTRPAQSAAAATETTATDAAATSTDAATETATETTTETTSQE